MSEMVLAQGGAQTACLLLRRDKSLSIEAEAAIVERGTVASILGSEPVGSSQRVPISLVHYVQRMKERVILSDAAADAGKFVGDEYFARTRPRSVLCLPILRQAEVVGLLYLENNLLVGAFTLDRLAALELLASQAAISLQIALLLAEERAARAAAEVAERRAAFLAEAGVVLSESLDYEKTLVSLGSLCACSLACWCVIDIVEGREIRRIAGAHVNPEKASALAELLRRYPPRWNSGHPSATVLRTGEPLLMAELPDEVLRSKCDDEGHFRLLRELGTSTAVADLLDISRLEANGGMLLELVDVDLGALVREVVERFESDLARSRCVVSMQGDGRTMGRWDRSRVDQVLTNLLSNAIKFGAGMPIELSFGSERGMAWLTVQDHGIGIEPAERVRIFGRFQRAVSERHYGGLGLGLYISRRIVEDHGGSIRCESQVGSGSTFTFNLPCAGPPGPAVGLSL